MNISIPDVTWRGIKISLFSFTLGMGFVGTVNTAATHPADPSMAMLMLIPLSFVSLALCMELYSLHEKYKIREATQST